MKKIYTKKSNKTIIYLLLFFMLISITSIFSINYILSIKQLIWYFIGFFLIYLTCKLNYDLIFKYYKFLYIIGNILLLLLLFFASSINNSKCWFTIGPFSFQPSEFMKIFLIITNGVVITKEKNEIKKIFKVTILTLIPSILTFLEPDTGMVMIYFIISFVMLYISGVNKKWFLSILTILIIFISVFLYMYFYNENLFIKLFGTNFFYRIDRLLDWKNGSGMQLTNALIGIGSAFIFGFGFNNTPIYIPEAQTDFIFSICAINYGFLGTSLLIFLLLYFDVTLIKCAKKVCYKDSLIISGIVSMLIYQQIQNIGMNIGILPITGITLPFISYGGSSLLSYMISIGIILNILKRKRS